MREIEAIINAYEQAKDQGIACTIATVVHVEGSSYRKAGARMLVDENGQMTGAISGGCLEGDALRKALHALHQGENKLISYDTSDEDDAVIGAQLGCNGVIQVLFEPLDYHDLNNPIELLKTVTASDTKWVIISIFNLDKLKKQPGTLLAYDDKMNAIGNAFTPLHSQLAKDAIQVFKEEYPHFGAYQKDGSAHHAFLELYNPPPNLVLVGAGNDAQVLATMADALGWNITVTDGRPTHANQERFISSCQVVVSRPEQVLENVELTERTAFVLISHNYQYDLSVLKILLEKPIIPYIGILGPKKKFQRMLDDLKSGGIEVGPEQLDRIYAPVGLNLGAETPAEIALSILSEVQMVLTNTNGDSLKMKKGTIHDKSRLSFKVKSL